MDPLLLLFVSMLGFVGGHFLLSFSPVRQRLATRIGEAVFLALYSLLALAVLWAHGKAPRMPPVGSGRDWASRAGDRHARRPRVDRAVALFPHVTAVGGERLVRSSAPIAGIATVTRHPFLWGVPCGRSPIWQRTAICPPCSCSVAWPSSRWTGYPPSTPSGSRIWERPRARLRAASPSSLFG